MNDGKFNCDKHNWHSDVNECLECARVKETVDLDNRMVKCPFCNNPNLMTDYLNVAVYWPIQILKEEIENEDEEALIARKLELAKKELKRYFERYRNHKQEGV